MFGKLKNLLSLLATSWNLTSQAPIRRHKKKENNMRVTKENLDQFIKQTRAVKENMSNLRFDGLDLSGMDFSNCDLTDSSFIGCILDGAKFNEVTAIRTKFNNAKACDAVFLNADCEDADFRGAYTTLVSRSGEIHPRLTPASAFENANITGAKFGMSPDEDPYYKIEPNEKGIVTGQFGSARVIFRP